MPATKTASRSRSNSRATTAARAEVLGQLKEDHKRVKKAYRDFGKLDVEQQPAECEAIVQQVCLELTVHATLEEELLYPAAHGAIEDEDLVDEAEVEHESVKALIEQLQGMTAADEKYAARFTVLCEYVMHHVKEEESEMFPQLEAAKLDWQTMATAMDARREELMAADGAEGDDDTATETADAAAPSKAKPGTNATAPVGELIGSDADTDDGEASADEAPAKRGRGPAPANGTVRSGGATSRKI